MKEKVLVLGGGLLQVPLVKKAKEEGYQVCVADYYPKPPAKSLSDGFRQISTFSLQDNYEYAREEGINYICTIGSDQPVFTAAQVSEKLGLPHPITGKQGQAFTNKLLMKAIMVNNNLPTPKFKVFTQADEIYLEDMVFPLVVKPVDSQGQRGVYLIGKEATSDQVKRFFEEAQKFSRTRTVIFEEFYEGKEITVNVWVKAGQAFSLLTTDRLHFDDGIALGLCKQQRYPSEAALGHEDEIQKSLQKLVEAFEIKDGPLYVQMIVGRAGAKFIEFGYRIGGGFEAEIIPKVTGIDILDLYFRLITQGENLFHPQDLKENYKLGSISFLFAKAGRAKKFLLPKEFKQNGKLFISEGALLEDIINATSRIGCFTYYSNDYRDYEDMLEKVDRELGIYDDKGVDLLIHGLWE